MRFLSLERLKHALLSDDLISQALSSIIVVCVIRIVSSHRGERLSYFKTVFTVENTLPLIDQLRPFIPFYEQRSWLELNPNMLMESILHLSQFL